MVPIYTKFLTFKILIKYCFIIKNTENIRYLLRKSEKNPIKGEKNPNSKSAFLPNFVQQTTYRYLLDFFDAIIERLTSNSI